ncbi:competence CoiA-like predicted nuclease [Weissella beninensis]|nr:competence CoiA-like predicted nuclease [Periweissella beninensis]
MLMAYDQLNTLIAASQILTTGPYFCPICQQPVIKRVGLYKVAHFAHYQKACLEANVSEGETVEHLKGKLQLVEFFKDHYQTSLEVYFPQIKQRADLLLQNKERKIAIEFQCSPISLTKLMERTSGYQQLGISVIWILGQRYFNQLNKESVLTKFGTLVNHKVIVLAWDIRLKYLKIIAGLAKCDFQKILLITRQVQTYEQYYQALMAIKQLKVNLQINATLRARHALKWAQYIYRGSQQKTVKRWAYRDGCQLVGAPWLVHATVKMPLGLKCLQAEWRCQNILNLQQYQIGEVISLMELKKRWLRPVDWWPMRPDLLVASQMRLMDQMITDLVVVGVLRPVNTTHVEYIAKPQWFKNLDKKYQSYKN